MNASGKRTKQRRDAWTIMSAVIALTFVLSSCSAKAVTRVYEVTRIIHVEAEGSNAEAEASTTHRNTGVLLQGVSIPASLEGGEVHCTQASASNKEDVRSNVEKE